MRRKLISHVIALVIGAGACMYVDEDIHEIEEKVVYRDRTRTVIKEVITERPDGSKVTERVTDKKEKVDSSAKKVQTIPQKKDWAVGVNYDLFTRQPVWAIDVKRRVIGDVYAGVYGRTDGVVGVGLTLLF